MYFILIVLVGWGDRFWLCITKLKPKLNSFSSWNFYLAWSASFCKTLKAWLFYLVLLSHWIKFLINIVCSTWIECISVWYLSRQVTRLVIRRSHLLCLCSLSRLCWGDIGLNGVIDFSLTICIIDNMVSRGLGLTRDVYFLGKGSERFYGLKS